MMDSDQDSNQDQAPFWGSAAPEELGHAAPPRSWDQEAPRGHDQNRTTAQAARRAQEQAGPVAQRHDREQQAASPFSDRDHREPPRYPDADLNEVFRWDEEHDQVEPFCQDQASPWNPDHNFDRASPSRLAAQHQTERRNWDEEQRELRYWDQDPTVPRFVAQEEQGAPRAWQQQQDAGASPPPVAGARGGSPLLRARRRLFSCPAGARGSPGSDVRQQLRSVAERDRLKWNFDFESEQPLPGGNFAWEAVPAASVCAFYRPVNLRRAGKRAAAGDAAAGSSSTSCCLPHVSSSSSSSSSTSSSSSASGSSSSGSSANVSPEPSGPGPGPPSSREAGRGGTGGRGAAGGGGGGDGGAGGVGDSAGSPTSRDCSVSIVPRKRSRLGGSRRRGNPALCATRTASPAARGSTT